MSLRLLHYRIQHWTRIIFENVLHEVNTLTLSSLARQSMEISHRKGRNSLADGIVGFN